MRILPVGNKYNLLTVIDNTPIKYLPQQHIYHLCQCECGNTKIVQIYQLEKGTVKSCGCINHLGDGNRTHSMSKTRIYNIWCKAKERTTNPNNSAYERYGGRGIKMCDSWLNSFENFYEDMKDTYKPNLTIDRIDNDKGYYKENCRWTTAKVQANNRRSNVLITHNNKTKNLKTWAIELGINPKTVFTRYGRGAKTYEQLFKPIER